MGKTGFSLFIAATLALAGAALNAEPPAKSEDKPSSSRSTKTTSVDPVRARIIESANGWMYVNGEWVHPDGYKFVSNKVMRTTAKASRTFPNPPGKLALENPTTVAPRLKSTTAPSVSEKAQTEAEKAAEQRRKNLAPRPASQTGTHL